MRTSTVVIVIGEGPGAAARSTISASQVPAAVPAASLRRTVPSVHGPIRTERDWYGDAEGTDLDDAHIQPDARGDRNHGPLPRPVPGPVRLRVPSGRLLVVTRVYRR